MIADRHKSGTRRPRSGFPGHDPWSLGFGLAAVCFAVTALFLWFPNDMRGGFTERSPGGDTAPGDAFFPVLLALGILALGVLQVAITLFSRPQGSGGRITRSNLVFLSGFLVVFASGLWVMRHAGPLAATLGEAGPYRALSDTAPWKYIGFVAGGLLVGLAPVIAIERRLRVKPALIVVAAIVVLIVIFDVLLADIRLPPNANV